MDNGRAKKLIEDIKGDRGNDAYNASEELAMMGADVVPDLVAAYSYCDDSQFDILWAIYKIGKSAIPKIVEALSSSDPRIRHNAAELLGELEYGAADAIPNLIKLLQDKHTFVANSAAYAIGKIGPLAKDAVPELIRLIDMQGVTANAIWALGEIGPAAKDAEPALTQVLLHGNAAKRVWALKALHRIHGEYVAV